MIEVVIFNGEGELKMDFAKLCRRQNVRQEFRSSGNSTNFNELAQRHVAMVEAAVMAAQVQARLLCPGFKIPSGSLLWSARNYVTCYALSRRTTNVNLGDRPPFEMRFGTITQRPISFLNLGYIISKRQDIHIKAEGVPFF